MATAKRVSARRTRTRAKPKAKPHPNSRTKPLPRPYGNRLVFSPALIADGKRRYETTPETLESIALDFSASRSTVRNIAKDGNWVRYVPPPRGLSRAAGIAAKAEALVAEASGGEAPPTSPGTAWSMRERIDELRNAVDEELAAVRALRAKLKSVPHSTAAAGRTSQTLVNLVATLERLHRLEIGVPQHDGQNTYDDMPADLDAFRENLARRIETFLASRPDVGLDEDTAAAPADEVR